MKAIIYENYGTPDVLKLREVSRPEPKANQVLVRILAASVNKADWHILFGKPFPVRFMTGLLKPKFQTPGADIVGIVERVGGDVIQFKSGDEVYGDLSGSGFGGFAEYVLTDESQLARKPSNLSYEEAAALPMAAVTALQGLRDKGALGSGQDVLINGASGGVGGFAVQIARALGANVTAVCSTNKLGLARKLGATTTIDYKKHDFTKGNQQYDLIFDVIGNRPLGAIDRVLKNGGRYVTCAFSIGAALIGPWKSITQRKKMINLLASSNQADLQSVCKMAEDGLLKPVIQEVFTLDDVPEALKKMGHGGAFGKLVITI